VVDGDRRTSCTAVEGRRWESSVVERRVAGCILEGVVPASLVKAEVEAAEAARGVEAAQVAVVERLAAASRGVSAGRDLVRLLD
jgi:hypothetical protein